MQLTREQVREVNRRAIQEFGIPGLILMENAGRAVADETERLLSEKLGGAKNLLENRRVVILCGRGNNGGDGYVAARHLHNRRIRPSVFVFSPFNEIAGDAAVNLEIIRKMGLLVEEVTIEGELREVERAASGVDVVVDALLGTGISGQVRGLIRSGIDIINRSGKPVIAVDIPSGLDANTGEVLGICVKADMTVTFVAEKTGFTRAQGPACAGRVVVAEIGIPRELLD